MKVYLPADLIESTVWLPAYNRTMSEWQLLTVTTNLTNDRKVVGSGHA